MAGSRNVWQKPTLINPKIVYTAMNGIRVAKLVEPEDVVEWAKYIGHSGGNYLHWVCTRKIWQFYTFLDKDGTPHCTVHSKTAEWWGKDHPDDKALKAAPHKALAKYGAPSTAYENWHRAYGGTDVIIDGERVVIMAVGHRDADGLAWWPHEQAIMDEWYATLEKVEEK